MDSNTLLEPLNQLLTKSQALLTLVQTDGWDNLQQQFDDYQQHMAVLADETYLLALNDANLAATAQTLIMQIQIFNQQLDEHAEQLHADIASELRQLLQADKALDAYRR